MIVTESKNRKIKICDQILEEIYSQIQKNDYDPEKGGIIVGLFLPLHTGNTKN